MHDCLLAGCHARRCLSRNQRRCQALEEAGNGLTGPSMRDGVNPAKPLSAWPGMLTAALTFSASSSRPPCPAFIMAHRACRRKAMLRMSGRQALETVPATGTHRPRLASINGMLRPAGRGSRQPAWAHLTRGGPRSPAQRSPAQQSTSRAGNSGHGRQATLSHVQLEQVAQQRQHARPLLSRRLVLSGQHGQAGKDVALAKLQATRGGGQGLVRRWEAGG